MDALLLETAQDTLNLKAAAIGVRPTGTASLMTTSCAVEVRATAELDVVTV